MSRSPEKARDRQRRYRAAHRDYLRERGQAQREKARAVIRTVLGTACVQCGSTDDLHCDHIDPATKTKSIGQMLTAPDAILRAELAKCQLLCKPCHREKTRASGDQTRHPAQHGGAQMYFGHGCRCAACRTWKRDYDIAWKRRKMVGAHSAAASPTLASGD